MPTYSQICYTAQRWKNKNLNPAITEKAMGNLTEILREQDTRVQACKTNFYLFCITYFPEFFRYKSPKFHKVWCKLFEKLSQGFFKFFVLIAFRESAKTSLSKLYLVWCICYKKRSFANYICYEREAAGDALFDIVTWLQSKDLIIADFGHLFPDEKPLGEKKPEKKSIYNFVTTNGVKVVASGIRKSTRGKIFGNERPDLYIIDDFENNTTKKSSALTRMAIRFFEELIPGLSGDAQVIFPCNKISDTGSVQWLIETSIGNPDWRVSEIPVMDNKGRLYWAAKYVLTDKEKEEKNKNIEDSKKRVVSIESLKRNLNRVRPGIFEQEMMNQPLVEGERFFNTRKVDERLAYLRTVEWQEVSKNMNNYMKTEGKWKYWGDYQKKHRYGIGSDVSEGYGRDSSTICCFDFNTGKQTAEYESDRCPPEQLGKEATKLGKKFGNCVVGIERNAVGIAAIDSAKNENYPNLYREKTVDKISNKPVQKFGWHTNSKTKALMLFEFQKAFEDGELEIMSRPLLLEMRAFTNYDLDVVSFDEDVSCHFDRVIAACIAWQMRKVKTIKEIQFNR